MSTWEFLINIILFVFVMVNYPTVIEILGPVIHWVQRIIVRIRRGFK